MILITQPRVLTPTDKHENSSDPRLSGNAVLVQPLQRLGNIQNPQEANNRENINTTSEEEMKTDEKNKISLKSKPEESKFKDSKDTTDETAQLKASNEKEIKEKTLLLLALAPSYLPNNFEKKSDNLGILKIDKPPILIKNITEKQKEDKKTKEVNKPLEAIPAITKNVIDEEENPVNEENFPGPIKKAITKDAIEEKENPVNEKNLPDPIKISK